MKEQPTNGLRALLYKYLFRIAAVGVTLVIGWTTFQFKIQANTEDIAEVNDVLAESKTISRLSVEGKVAVNTLSLQIYKRTGGNILNIVNTAKQRIFDLQDEGNIPPEVVVEDSNDYSAFIEKI